jgi:opacity protein-like surface antigen
MRTHRHRGWYVFMVMAVATVLPRLAAAQSPPTWTREASLGYGLGHVFRFEDRTYGNQPNISGGFALVHRSGWGVEVEANRTLGLTPTSAPCAIVIDGRPASCIGNAHNGVSAATITSANVRYQFGSGVMQPYLMAGLGILHTRSVWSTATVAGPRVVLTEEEMRDTGLGPDLGAGIRFRVGRHLSLGPEIRWLDASVRSRLNMAVTRLALRTALTW